MKLLAVLFALVSLGIFAPNLYADPVLTVNAGVAGGALVETPILGGETWVYTDTVANLGLPVPPLGLPLGSTVDNNVFTATFTDIAGVALLNVNDICANVGVLHAANPCSLAFSFTDTDLGVPFLESNVNLLGLLSADVNANVIGLEVGGASIGGGQAEFGFEPPPGGNPPPTSATPEPGSLSLLGTGLLGLAGIVRRKFQTV
jgi:hypothetical protein